MTADEFLACAHRRALSACVICVRDATLSVGARAAVITEISLAFKEDDQERAYGVVMLKKKSGTLDLLNRRHPFSINLLRVDQLALADDVIYKRYSDIQIDVTRPTPTVRNADATLLCSVIGVSRFGAPGANVYRLVSFAVDDVEVNSKPADPLVNHSEDFWRLDRPSLRSVANPGGANNRLRTTGPQT